MTNTIECDIMYIVKDEGTPRTEDRKDVFIMTRKIYEYRFADGTIYETYFDRYELAAAVRKHGKLVYKKFLHTEKI